MAEITKEEIRERLGNIDKIRDIILGNKLREYDTRIEKIESDVVRFQQEMRDRVEQVKIALSTDLQVAVDSLERKLRILSSTSQEESSDIQQQLERFTKKFSTNIQALDEIVYDQTSSLKGELSETRDKFQQDIRQLREQVLQDLEKRFSMLKDTKASREDIAEILLELGLRLKGTEFVSELKQATDNGMDELLLLKQSKTLE